ncbi:MAG: TrmH family RNA methyltransferase [Planctomycetes bacterium]|nr:TrmH family RNA methyltransferase [Planctomycetota bacterium]
MRKRKLEEHRAAAAQRMGTPRAPLYLILDNIRSLHNVGSIFRTADGFGVRKIFLTGITPVPPRPEISKTAIGADEVVEFEWMADPVRAALVLREIGVPTAILEQTDRSISIYEYSFPEPLGIVLGHEQIGVDAGVFAYASAVVEIPMLGMKHSHNVAVATGIVLAEVRRQWGARGAAR